MDSIICRKCKAPKHPCLFTPRDVKSAVRRPDGKLTSTCRQCRKKTRERYELKPANPGDWRVSMRAIFSRDVVAIPEFPNRRVS